MADSQLASDQHQGHGPILPDQGSQQDQPHLNHQQERNVAGLKKENISEDSDMNSPMGEKVENSNEDVIIQPEEEDNISNDIVSPDSSNTSLSLASNLERFALSDSMFNRQMVARSLLNTLRSVVNVEEDVTTVLSVLLRLSDDNEPTVRTELVDQVPHISAFCLEQVENQRLLDVHPKYLLPLVVKHLSDMNNQVRKSSQTALLTLVEKNLLTEDQINVHVYPALLRLANLESLDHCRAEAVALMSRMATLMGKEMSRKLFLDRFVAFCSDSLILVRKMCAIHFGDICAVMGEEVTENILLPLFANLCKDGMWGVRKACADVFVTVSCVCLMSTRRNRLAQLFVLLLMDLSRWVRLAAFQALGAFISTFADPDNPFLYYDEEGNIHAASQDTTEEDDVVPEEAIVDSGFGSRVASNAGSPMSDDLEEEIPARNGDWRLAFDAGEAQLSDATERLTLSESDGYNCFQYWREPIIEVSLKNDFYQSLERISQPVKDGGFMYQDSSMSMSSRIVRNKRGPIVLNENQIRHYSIFENCNFSYNMPTNYEEFEAIAPSTLHAIVPAELLYHYIQMTNSVLLQTLDSEIVRYCAFSFPAVALTLGRVHWPLLRNLYKKLASDLQWKVRRTLAFSIHELAAILGRELTSTDLVPVFNSFIRDLDEVRVGILKHLSSFISMLPTAFRNSYLEKIGEFLEPENDRNWRFRLELTQQLSRLCPFYLSKDVAFHLIPIAIRLLQDRVAEVRTSTVKSMAVLAELLSCSSSSSSKTKSVKQTKLLDENEMNPEEYLVPLAVNLVNDFAHHHNWSRRQTFASCCLHMRKSYPRVLLNRHLLPSILDLAEDPVANVRLIVARILKALTTEQSSIIINWDQKSKGNLLSDVNETVSGNVNDKIAAALEKLQNDPDRDVRQAASWSVISPLYSDSVPIAAGTTATILNVKNTRGRVLPFPTTPTV